ncbi:MAG: glycosyltransferase family 4 protein [Bdellovibrionales bacterium]|nr:glycosyltransferase family 4 protein [Bdellovibrionales bacterium]
MKLRILHLTQFLGVGGLEKVLFLLINEQVKAGHEIELVVYDYEQSWVEYFRSCGIKVDTSFVKSKGYDRKLLKYIFQKSKNFDIVHTHDLNPLMYASPVKFLHALIRKPFPRLIHTAHGMDHLHKRPITKLYEKLCSFQTNCTIGVSSAVCNYYFALGLPKKRVVNINNGTAINTVTDSNKIEARARLRNNFNLRPDALIWVSVARVVPLKDQLLICELAKQLPDMTFLLIGPSGDEQYWDKVKENKPANVLMSGSRSDINEILLGADFFISGSRHEGIPISVLEAGAMGLPCLLSDIAGHKVIQSGTNETIAMFFKTGDVRDFKHQAENLSTNNSLATSIAIALHGHVKNNFSSTTMYKNYLEVYLDQK